MSIDQRVAVARLVGHCEALVKSGLLSEHMEKALRRHIAETLVAFSMPSLAETEINSITQVA